MSDNVRLNVSGLGKCYATYRNNFARFAQWFGYPAQHIHEYWALEDLSFTLRRGEALAIIGQNGAGKSTLLKLITGTVRPTTGYAQILGRISAILELGIGFNPDFSARQNVYLAGGLMGLSIAELMVLMPDIEAFADIGEFFDQPLRVFSSGMSARLAFAVATAARPDVLIIDEALSVGDAGFQRKCFRRIEEFMEQGTSLLLVSHDTETVKKICKQALYLAKGRLAMQGDAKLVCDYYESTLLGGKKSLRRIAPSANGIDPGLLSDCEITYGDGSAVIESIWMENENRQKANVFQSRSVLRVCYRVHIEQRLINPVFAIMIKTREGVAVYGTDSDRLGLLTGTIESDIFLDVVFELDNNLAPGLYYLNCGMRHSQGSEPGYIHRRVDALIFRVSANESSTAAVGLADLGATLSIAVTV